MTQPVKNPKFFTFAALARHLRIDTIDEMRIEQDFRNGHIDKFWIDNLAARTSAGTQKRIKTLMPILNKYASFHKDESPYTILAIKDAELNVIDGGQKQFLSDNIRPDLIFEFWLKAYGIKIDEIKIVIPFDEAVKYEKYLKGVRESEHFTLNEVVHVTDNKKIKDNPLQISLQHQTVKTERPSQLDRKGKVLAPATLLDAALQDYYKKKKRKATGCSYLIEFMKIEFNKAGRPKYLDVISDIGFTDEKCLLLKPKFRNEHNPSWYSMAQLTRIYKKRSGLAVYTDDIPNDESQCCDQPQKDTSIEILSSTCDPSEDSPIQN